MDEAPHAESVAERMRLLAEHATVMARDIEGITLDYSESSIEQVEAILHSLHRQNRRAYSGGSPDAGARAWTSGSSTASR